MGRDWNERYATGEASDRAPEPLLVAAVERRTPGRALDLACGMGRHALYLAANQWQVTAVDSSSAAIASLAERVSDGLSLRPVLADLETNEFLIQPGRWDLIVDCCYLQRSLFLSIRAGLRPGGLFVGIFPTEGINPKFLMRGGEGRELFGDWKLLHYSEGQRTEIVAEKPMAV